MYAWKRDLILEISFSIMNRQNLLSLPLPCGPSDSTYFVQFQTKTTRKSCFIGLYHVNVLMYLNFNQIWFPSHKSDSIDTYAGNDNLCVTYASI